MRRRRVTDDAAIPWIDPSRPSGRPCGSDCFAPCLPAGRQEPGLAMTYSLIRHSGDPAGLIQRVKVCYIGGGSSADVAQLAEQLICNQQVIGSTPIIGSILHRVKLLRKNLIFEYHNGLHVEDQHLFSLRFC